MLTNGVLAQVSIEMEGGTPYYDFKLCGNDFPFLIGTNFDQSVSCMIGLYLFLLRVMGGSKWAFVDNVQQRLLHWKLGPTNTKNMMIQKARTKHGPWLEHGKCEEAAVEVKGCKSKFVSKDVKRVNIYIYI